MDFFAMSNQIISCRRVTHMWPVMGFLQIPHTGRNW